MLYDIPLVANVAVSILHGVICSRSGVRVTKRAALCWMDFSRFIWVMIYHKYFEGN